MPRKPKIKPASSHTDTQGQLSLFDGIVSDDLRHAGIPGVAVEVLPEDAAMMGAFEEDAMGFEDVMDCQDAPEAALSSPEDAHRQRIERLREHHRVLSELIVSTNRDIARIVGKAGRLESPEASVLLARIKSLQEQRAAIEAETQDVMKALKALERRLTPAPRSIDGKGGLIKVRHPQRDFFLADLFDYAMKDDGASMEAPIFTLSTKPDLSIWEWRSKDGTKYVKVAPSVLGRATQYDKDILIYVVSQLVEGLNRGREDAQHRTVRFTVYDLLVTTNRQTSGDGYQRLHEAFERLRGTTITTDIRTGGERIREGFGIIDSWRIIEKSRTDERMIAVEVTLSRWLYNAVQAFEVLTIHPDYFRLRKPLARRLYEIARKHCGHQARWTVNLDLLQEKTGSKSTLKEFRRALRAIQDDDSLPEYRFVLHQDNRVTFYVRNPQRLARSITRRIVDREERC
ncbi:MAG: replication initiator protein A [Thiomonas sp.]